MDVPRIYSKNWKKWDKLPNDVKPANTKRYSNVDWYDQDGNWVGFRYYQYPDGRIAKEHRLPPPLRRKLEKLYAKS